MTENKINAKNSTIQKKISLLNNEINKIEKKELKQINRIKNIFKEHLI